jgi:glutaminase
VTLAEMARYSANLVIAEGMVEMGFFLDGLYGCLYTFVAQCSLQALTNTIAAPGYDVM